jgi:hypothetical protein
VCCEASNIKNRPKKLGVISVHNRGENLQGAFLRNHEEKKKTVLENARN